MSRRCPACGSKEVTFESVIATEAVVSLLSDLAIGLWFLLSLPFRALWVLLRFAYRVVVKTYDRLAHRNDTVAVLDDTTSGSTADLVAVVLFVLWKAIASPVCWLCSVTTDIQIAANNGRVNPVAMLANLGMICGLAVLIIGGSILLIRKWSGGG